MNTFLLIVLIVSFIGFALSAALLYKLLTRNIK